MRGVVAPIFIRSLLLEVISVQQCSVRFDFSAPHALLPSNIQLVRNDHRMKWYTVYAVNRAGKRASCFRCWFDGVLGSALLCHVVRTGHQQRDFWDIFSRLEIVTRTEALLNIALRGGKGCPAR